MLSRLSLLASGSSFGNPKANSLAPNNCKGHDGHNYVLAKAHKTHR